MKISMPRRQGRLLGTSNVRKTRAIRPSLEACEARALLSGATTRIAFEPLQFLSTALSTKGQAVDVAGTLSLTEGPNGGLAGTLVEADGESLKVQGTLQGQRIDLSLRAPNGPTTQATGPVVLATTAAGQPTLQRNGFIQRTGLRPRGTFTLQGSDVVLPAGHLQDPKDVVRVIPAGTTLVPIDFSGEVTHGPDAGTSVSGVLSLGKVSANGTFAGSLADPVRGTIPATGRIVGGRIELEFDLGAGLSFGGVGPFEGQKVGKGQVELTTVGSLQTQNSADSGDWATRDNYDTVIGFLTTYETINAAKGSFSIGVYETDAENQTVNYRTYQNFTLSGTAKAGVDYTNIYADRRGPVPNSLAVPAEDPGDGIVTQFIGSINGTLIHHPGEAPSKLDINLDLKQA